jgi:catechol 2,3-dioxygenase-like lactoylglutathione lyase family enzyme
MSPAYTTPTILTTSKVIAFVATTNAARAKAFYGGTLGLPLVSEDRFAVVFDANGTMLRVTPVQQFTPFKHTVLGWEVADIEAAVKQLREAGIQFQQYGLPGQNEQGIWSAPGGAKVAWFADPDGNILSVSQH